MGAKIRGRGANGLVPPTPTAADPTHMPHPPPCPALAVWPRRPAAAVEPLCWGCGAAADRPDPPGWVVVARVGGRADAVAVGVCPRCRPRFHPAAPPAARRGPARWRAGCRRPTRPHARG